MMVEQLESSQHVLSAAANQSLQMGRAKKPVPMHLAKDLPVALGQFDAGDMGSTLEAGKSGLIHPHILPRTQTIWAWR